MKRYQFSLIFLSILLPALSACSSSNNQAPDAGQVHRKDYLVYHAFDADKDLSGCKSCHGTNLAGKNKAASCLTCHPDGEPITTHVHPFSDPSRHGEVARSKLRECFICHGSAPNRFDGGFLSDPAMFNAAGANCSATGCHSEAGAHPTRWQGLNDNTSDYRSSHRGVSQSTIETGCSMCHQVTEDGPQPRNDAPSCLSGSMTYDDGTVIGCHAGGPASSHDLPYDTPELHGEKAKADMAACQTCHGTPGTIYFDGGTTGLSCAACHPEAGAHPALWQGDNDDTLDYMSSHRVVSQNTIETGCAICHQVVAEGPQPHNEAPSCLSASITYGDGSTIGCHAGGPATAHDLPFDTPDLHGADAKADLAACQTCHGTPETTSFDGGTSDTSCAACHPEAGAHPTYWRGDNDTSTDYVSSHRSAGKQSTTCAICHDVEEGRSSPNANAPSCFSNSRQYGDGSTSSCHASGPGAPHPVPYTDPLQHGADAKDNLTSCVPCHATPANAGAGDNPRFNVAIGDLANGCESCHAASTAHPTPLWTGAAAGSHSSAKLMDTACALCHGGGLDGGTGPACTECHSGGSPITLPHCTSCHNWPPDGQNPAGDQYPNRDGAHAVHNLMAGVNGNCSVCHEGAGTESAAHFNGGGSAVIAFASTYNAQSGAASFNSTAKTCGTTRCHGGQTTPNWYNGSVDVNSDCESCHSTSSGEFNAADSGAHRDHRRFDCTTCHDTGNLGGEHFSNLATTAYEGNPWETLDGNFNYNHTTGNGCDVSGCHGTRNWFDGDD
jgi:predicted CxxxxCH...CXXCH cytochrome family protein